MKILEELRKLLSEEKEKQKIVLKMKETILKEEKRFLKSLINGV